MTKNELVVILNSRVNPTKRHNNEDRESWLMDSFFYIDSRITHYNPDWNSRVYESDIFNEVQEYMLPPDCLGVSRVRITQFSPERRTTEIELKRSTRDSKLDGETLREWYIRDNYIGLIPLPRLNSTARIKIWYHYEPEYSDREINKLPYALQSCIVDRAVAIDLSQDDDFAAAQQQKRDAEIRIEKLAKELASLDKVQSSHLTDGLWI